MQDALGLVRDDQALIVSVVSRLTSQKGLDLVLTALPALVREGVQLAIQGTGDPALEAAFRMAEQVHPGRVAVHIGYDEPRAHRLVAGADVIAVPSRFEPCGLTQLYGLRYGTVPLVRRVGGLADTVVDDAGGAGGVAQGGAAADRQTGFVFDAATPGAFEACTRRALLLKRNAAAWQAVMRRGMSQNLSWTGPARDYLALYAQARLARAAGPRRIDF